MKNETVAGIMKDTQQLWMKWRDCVPGLDSDQWNEIHRETTAILERYGTHQVPKEVNGIYQWETEFVSEPVVLWFLGLLEERARENETHCTS